MQWPCFSYATHILFVLVNEPYTCIQGSSQYPQLDPRALAHEILLLDGVAVASALDDQIELNQPRAKRQSCWALL